MVAICARGTGLVGEQMAKPACFGRLLFKTEQKIISLKEVIYWGIAFALNSLTVDHFDLRLKEKEHA
jgi:hypothetical protein